MFFVVVGSLVAFLLLLVFWLEYGEEVNRRYMQFFRINDIVLETLDGKNLISRHERAHRVVVSRPPYPPLPNGGGPQHRQPR